MEKNNYSKNDCFLMKGSDNNDPMTVYQITDIDETHTYAKSLSITTQMVHGWPISQEYDKNIPENAIPLPSNSWQWARKQMSSFVKETIAYLYDNIIDGKTDIIVGGHYIDRGSDITTVEEIGDERIRFKVFKIDEDFITYDVLSDQEIIEQYHEAEAFLKIVDEEIKKTDVGDSGE